MANLYIRDVDESLLWRLRQDAVASRRSLKDHCISLLSVDAVVAPAELVDDPSKYGTQPRNGVVGAPIPARHNPKTCRIYKCGQCAATKEKP